MEPKNTRSDSPALRLRECQCGSLCQSFQPVRGLCLRFAKGSQVSHSHHPVATQARRAASTVRTAWRFARSKRLVTSPNPSPPSVIGRRSSTSPGRALRHPRAMGFRRGLSGQSAFELVRDD